MASRLLVGAAPGVLGAFLLAAPAAAQCATPFVPTLQLAGTDGIVRAVTVWDRDGAGPLPPLVVLGGSFAQAGTVPVDSVVAFDPAAGTWSALGAGVGHPFRRGEVLALATAGNGDLLVGGDFAMAGGANGFDNVARFDGTTWSPLGTGTTGAVRALAVLPSGDVVAGGDFWSAGGTLANAVARWNGTAWSPLGAGTNATVRALAVLANGDLVAGGDFTQAGAVAADRVARWNGTAWSAMGTGLNATVRALGVQGPTLFAGGDFTFTASARAVASWNGSTWQPVGFGLSPFATVHALAASPSELWAGGNAVASVSPNDLVARLEGTQWRPHDGTADPAATAYALAILPGGGLVAGGDFADVDGVPAEHAALGPRTWRAFGVCSGDVRDLAAHRDGTVVAIGDLALPGVAAAAGVAAWDGLRWTALQPGLPGPPHALAALPDGTTVIATGLFTPPQQALAWTGTAWVPLGGPWTTFDVRLLLATARGELLAAGYDTAGDHVQRWTGANWVPLGPPPPWSGFPDAAAEAPNGDLLVAVTLPGGGPTPQRVSFWRWDGAAWAPLGAPLPGLADTRSLVLLADGTPVAGGSYGVLRWTGAAWAPLGGSGAPLDVHELVPLADGDLLAAGTFRVAGGVSCNHVARWNGAAWAPVGAGTNGPVTAAARLPDGDVVFAGAFGRAGGAPSPTIVRLTTTCPATASAVGAPCLGAAGPLELRATALPWLGGSFVAAATGLSPSAVAARVLGLQPLAVPLASLLPVGNPACSLLASPDDLALLAPAAGAASFAVGLPDVAALLGARLHAQVLQLELGPQLQPVALLGSNALALTVGSF